MKARPPESDKLKSDYSLLQSSDFFPRGRAPAHRPYKLSTVNCQTACCLSPANIPPIPNPLGGQQLGINSVCLRGL
ncbi:hypothetical protein [Microcoleus sp. CAWBG58]|uniref:hypothetical protein n=1 Tax=Microcoleus sp. CAWBG58 TaxID=2841651 RepID=UPI0025F4A7E6|nr:hypothetical protein [Microcoleus sp. CAWBG58]